MLTKGLTAWRPKQNQSSAHETARTHIRIPDDGDLMCPRRTYFDEGTWEEVHDPVTEQYCRACRRFALMLVTGKVPEPMRQMHWYKQAEERGMV